MRITITDSTGHSITIPDLPDRIVVAGKATVMVQDAIFLFEESSARIVAIENRKQSLTTFLPYVDKDLEGKAVLEKSAGPEQIAAHQPDLVILKSFMAEQLGTPLEELGIPVLYLDLETPEAFYQDIFTLGQIFGNPTRAEEIVSFYQSRAQAIEEMMAGLKQSQKPEVLLLSYNDRGEDIAFEIPPPSWLQTSIVEKAGGIPVWADASGISGWTIVSFEQIAAWDPDQIFIIDYSGRADIVVDELKADDLWGELSAVQNNHLYSFGYDFYSWDQPDTRWILGLEWIATKIQPQRAEDIDILSEIEAFYEFLYRIDPAQIESQILPLLRGDI
jgi:iron complex transport system substrate-binding protein